MGKVLNKIIIGIFTYNNGDKYEGEVKDNRKNGKGIYCYADGEKYDGEWRNDNKNGNGKIQIILGTYFFQDGTTKAVEFRFGRLIQ